MADFFRYIRCFLVDQVEPVMIEDMGIAAPGKGRRPAVIIIRIIIGRRSDGKAFILVACIFLGQCIPVVFEMAENKELAVVRRADDIDAVFGIA